MNVLKPNQRATVYTLLERGSTQREIARITGIDRKTVRSYQRRWQAGQSNSPGVATGPDAVGAQIAPPRPPASPPASIPVATSLCEPHRDFIEAQLRLRRNAMAIYQDLVDSQGFAGQYNSVKRFVARLRHKEPEQFDRLSFLPGEEMQVDYGEGAPTLVPGTDRYRKPRLFVATLRYSRASYRCVVWKSSQQVWAELHERAFRHFGGCPQYVVLDNLKEGVIKPDLYEPELNPVFAATLAHYGVVADPARVRDPNRKGTVEHAIGHTQATALKGRRFESIEAQNEFLAHWEKNWAAKRIHGTERRQVQAMFEEERPHLKALPLLGMQYFDEAVRTVCDDSCVRVDHSSYAARPAAIGSKVRVRIFAQRIQIFDLHTGALLRSHPKAERPGTVVLPQDERVFNPSRETRLILRQAGQIGEHAARLCQLLFAIEGRVGQRKLWGIVGLVRRYPARCVDTACAQALEQGIYSYKRVQALTESLFADALNAIEAQAGGDPVAPTTAVLTQQHGLIRDAHEYGDLFAHAAATATTTATATAATTHTTTQGGRA
ncbi:IS21 family transposase [Hydrogenophaga sp.]|uniref:IS21 family transposase n=1 Tax=Hydrogenophaga sp. TaxID=1904254 RepID=UPI0027174F17|nr:IS21 family transposase [Hydrogenophaga sp.]MDO9604422.1 IS21 family transposase [Hydrogenophaga sp.]